MIWWKNKMHLVCQVEEAQRKHDLLVEILHKEQDHKSRLVSINTHSKHPFTSTYIINNSYNACVECTNPETKRRVPACRQTSPACSGHTVFVIEC